MRFFEWLYDDSVMQESEVEAFFSNENMAGITQSASGFIVEKLIKASTFWGCQRIEIKLEAGLLKFSADIDFYPVRSEVVRKANTLRFFQSLAPTQGSSADRNLSNAIIGAFSVHPRRVVVRQGRTKRQSRRGLGLIFDFEKREILHEKSLLGSGGAWFTFDVEDAADLDVPREIECVLGAQIPAGVTLYLNDVLVSGKVEGGV